ncbi:hypothetical protein [Streptomyces sp. NPDC004285]
MVEGTRRLCRVGIKVLSESESSATHVVPLGNGDFFAEEGDVPSFELGFADDRTVQWLALSGAGPREDGTDVRVALLVKPAEAMGASGGYVTPDPRRIDADQVGQRGEPPGLSNILA